MEKNVAGKWVVFAFQDEGGANPGEPVTGDAANITANLRIDGGAANAVDDVNPTELEDGYYIFDITATESNGDLLLIAPASSTANVNVIGVPGSIYTTPPNFNALGIASDGDISGNVDGNVVGSVASVAAQVTANVTAISGDTAAADNLELDYDGTGYNKSNSTIGTCTTNTDMRGTDSAFLAASAPTNFSDMSITATTGLVDITQAGADKAWNTTTRTLSAATNITSDASAITMSSSGVVGTVNLVNTTTTNTDMRGTDSAATAAALATVDSNVDAILVDTSTTIPAQITALNDISVADILTTQMTEAYAADGTAPTLSQALFLIQQTIGDFAISGTTITVKKLDGSTTAATYTLDDGTSPTSRTRST